MFHVVVALLKTNLSLFFARLEFFSRLRLIAKNIVTVGHLTTKSDVYSFGVVLLEMICGRRVIDRSKPFGEHNLVRWAKPYLSNKRKVKQVLDRQLEGQYSADEACKVAALALRCLSKISKPRPNMNEVASTLEQLVRDLQTMQN